MWFAFLGGCAPDAVRVALRISVAPACAAPVRSTLLAPDAPVRLGFLPEVAATGRVRLAVGLSVLSIPLLGTARRPLAAPAPPRHALLRPQAGAPARFELQALPVGLAGRKA